MNLNTFFPRICVGQLGKVLELITFERKFRPAHLLYSFKDEK